MKPRPLGNQAASQLVGSLLAFAVFSVTVYTTVQVAYELQEPNDRLSQADLQAKAAALQDQILRFPGLNWYALGACANGALNPKELQPDSVSRFGLAEEPCDGAGLGGAPGALGFHKIKSLKGAGLGADDANAKLDYQEAYESLRLDESDLEFYLKATPVLPDVRQALLEGKKELLIRPLAIGHWAQDWGGGESCERGWTNNQGVDSLINNAIGALPTDVGNAANDGHDALYGAPPCSENAGELVLQESTRLEASYLDALVSQFDLGVPVEEFASGTMPYNPAGDVFPDSQAYLPDLLEDALFVNGAPTFSKHNMLFILSGADNDELNTANVRGKIIEWVEAGGYLVVFGNDDKVSYLNSDLQVRLESDEGESGAVAIPGHELLSQPYPLDVPSYDDRGRNWRYDGSSHTTRFEHIVVDDSHDYLALSHEDAVGLGIVALVAYQPWALTTYDQGADCEPGTLTDDCEALRLYNNLFMVLYGDLYIDYGPLRPIDQPIGTYTSLQTTYHPYLRGVVELNVLIQVWSSGAYTFETASASPTGDWKAPTQVEGLEATTQSSSAIKLTWDAASDDVGVTGYKIYRSTTNGGPYEPVTVVQGLEYTNTMLTHNTWYYYVVTALDAVGNEGDPSEQAAAKTNNIGGGGGSGGGGCQGENTVLFNIALAPCMMVE